LKPELHSSHRFTQHQVQDDERERLRLRDEFPHAALAVRELRHHVTVQLQELRETFAHFRAVFDEENLSSPRRRR